MNQPWGMSSRAFGDFSSRERATTCAEPVLPQTSTACSRARKPVPAATTALMPRARSTRGD